MAIRFPRATSANLADPSWWQRLFLETKVEASNGTITNDSFAPRAGNSVIGRPSNTDGTPSDIQMAPGQFLVNRANLIKGDTLLDADIPASIARDSEVTAAISAHEAAADPHPGYTTTAELSAAITAHEGASNPHPTYLTQTEGDALYEPIGAAAAVLPDVADDYADDAAAALGGIAVGQLYHTSGAVKIRLA
jgi:hypothetical protein